MANYKDVPDEQLGCTYPFPDVNSDAELVRSVCEFLEKNKMSVFADQSTRYYDEKTDSAYNIICGDYRNPISKDNNEITVYDGIGRHTLSLGDYERTDTAVYNLETATNSFTKGEIDNPLTVSADEIITIEGWAFDSDSQRVYDRIILQFGDWMIELEIKERMDVVNAWNCEKYLNSGFYGCFLVGECEPGSYDADSVMIDTTNGTYFKENGVVTIIIK